MANSLISFVIPLYNERENITPLFEGIRNECISLGLNYEVILVDDGSQDGSWDIISNLAKTNPSLKGIRFRSCGGKGPALTAGFAEAAGEIIFTMDADGQDSPGDIKKFLEKIQGSWDFAIGWRKCRNDNFRKRLVSKVYNTCVRIVVKSPLHDHNCGYKCFRAEVGKGHCLYGESHRFFTLNALDRGFRCTEVQVEHFARNHGKSKFGNLRLLEGGLDFITFLFLKRFRYKPLHLLGTFGLGAFFIGVLGISYLAVLWLFGQGIGNRPLLIYSAVSLLFGFQCLITGLLADLFLIFNVKKEDLYSIKSTVNVKGNSVRPGAWAATENGGFTSPTSEFVFADHKNEFADL